MDNSKATTTIVGWNVADKDALQKADDIYHLLRNHLTSYVIRTFIDKKEGEPVKDTIVFFAAYLERTNTGEQVWLCRETHYTNDRVGVEIEPIKLSKNATIDDYITEKFGHYREIPNVPHTPNLLFSWFVDSLSRIHDSRERASTECNHLVAFSDGNLIDYHDLISRTELKGNKSLVTFIHCPRCGELIDWQKITDGHPPLPIYDHVEW